MSEHNFSGILNAITEPEPSPEPPAEGKVWLDKLLAEPPRVPRGAAYREDPREATLDAARSEILRLRQECMRLEGEADNQEVVRAIAATRRLNSAVWLALAIGVTVLGSHSHVHPDQALPLAVGSTLALALLLLASLANAADRY